MNYGMYLSATGVLTNSYRQDVIANNLANAETVGFKRNLALFHERLAEQIVARQTGAPGFEASDPLFDLMTGGTLAAPTAVDTRQGELEHTGNTLDVAIQGSGYFVVQHGNEKQLTRDGRFMLDRAGNLILANSPVGVEIIDILPAGQPTRCTVRHSWMGKVPASTDEMRAAYDQVYESVHAAVRDEDFAMLPQCGQGVRHGQHDHMVIGRNEIGVQHMIRVFAQELGIALQ